MKPGVRYLLGIDSGGTATKAALFAPDGSEVAVAGRRVQNLTPQSGWSERDMDVLWQDTTEVIAEVLQTAGVAPAQVLGIACAGHGNGLYLIDGHGLPVRKAVNSSDSRAQSYVDGWRRSGVETSACQLTAQTLWAAQPPALLAWFRDHDPPSLERARWILMCKDYIRFRLTGEVFGERTDFSGASLINVPLGEHDTAVLQLFGIAQFAGLLPPLVDSASLCGTVTRCASTETGLLAGTPVAGGMFDVDACCFGSGVLNERLIAVVSGTWGNNLAVTDLPVTDGSIFMTSCFSVPGKFLLLEGSPTSAGNLDWGLREFGINTHSSAEAEAGAVAPEESDTVFLPFLYGSNVHPLARGSFVGIAAQTTRGHLIRSIYEGICFAHRTHLERLLRQRGPAESIRLSGGAARSPFWGQMFADCLGLPVEVPESEELGAKGAAIAAGVAVGLFAGFEEAVLAMVRVGRRYEPRPQVAKIYDRKYQRYCDVVFTLNKMWPEFGK